MALTLSAPTSTVRNENPNDITRRLPSLQFESALTDEEKELLSLRSRSHAITVSICGQAVFLVDILSEVRQLRGQLQSTSRKTAMIMKDTTDPKDVLNVGILGGGRLGSQIAHCLLTFGQMNPQNLQISTRRPETLEYLQHKGVDCYYDNKKLVSSVNLLFICVLPSQLPAIADEIKHWLSQSTVVYSPAASITLPKLKLILQTPNVVKPDFRWTSESIENHWDYNVNIKMSLEKKEVIDLINPIDQNGKRNVVFCNERLVEMMVCSCINMAAAVGLNQKEMLECINIVILGDSERTPVPRHVLITAADLGLTVHFSSEPCSTIDITTIGNQPSPLQHKMKIPEFIELFTKRFSCVFEELHHLMAQA